MARTLSISNSDIKKVVVKAIAFLTLSWIISSGLYYGLDYVYMRSYGGNSGAYVNHVIRTKYDAYIFGASRAVHHYDPSIIEEKLGLSCYNAGDDAKNPAYQLGLLKMLLANHTPKLVIYEIGDLSPKLGKGIMGLHPYYYHNDDIKEIIETGDKWAKVKFAYPLYAYNRKFVAILIGFLRSYPPSETGFRPLAGEMHPGEIARINESSKQPGSVGNFDPNAVVSLRLFAHECREKGIGLIFSFSPSYVPREPAWMDVIRQIAVDNDIPLVLYGENLQFIYNPKLFKDTLHLNANGTRFFTQLFADSLAVILEREG